VHQVTIRPCTTDRLIAKSGKQIVFSPELRGRRPFHPHKARLFHGPLWPSAGAVITAELVVNIYTPGMGPEPGLYHYRCCHGRACPSTWRTLLCYRRSRPSVAQFLLASHSRFVQTSRHNEKRFGCLTPSLGRSHSTVVGFSLAFLAGRFCLNLSAILVCS